MNIAEHLSYERVLKPPKTLKSRLPLILLILLYAFVLSLWIFPVLYFGLSLQFIMLIPLSLLLVILPTRKYRSVEYEYAFGGGCFTYSKIYGKSRRKQILSVDLSDAILIAPADKDHMKRAQESPLTTVTHATLYEDSTDIWLILYPINKKETGVVLFHSDERSLRFLRQANPRATVRTPLSRS